MRIRPLNFYTTTNISLSLEDFTNSGLTQAEMKAEIEKIPDLRGTNKMWVEHSGFNHNLIVRTMCTHPDDIQEIVDRVQFRLLCLLEKKLETVSG